MKSLIEKLVNRQRKTPEALNSLWLSHIAGLDDLSTLEKSIEYLPSISSDSSISEIERFELLLLVDEGNHRRIEKISSLYAKSEKMQVEIESRILEAIYYYQRQLFLSYQQHIDGALTQSSQLDPRLTNLHLIIGRAMYAAFAMLKARYFSNQPTPNSIWLQIFNLYKIAEQKNLLASPIQLYPHKIEVILANAFAKACMLDVLDRSSMSKHQIYVANKILNNLLQDIKISATFDEKKHTHFIDLDVDHGAKRIRRPNPRQTCRYWGLDDFCIELELILHSISNHKSLVRFSLENLEGHPDLLDVTTKMHTEWSRTKYLRQRRKEPRKQVEESVIVAYGVDALCDKIKYINNKVPSQTIEPTYSNQSSKDHIGTYNTNKLSIADSLPKIASGELTRITDESTQGYGAYLSRDANQIAKPDTLIGLVFKEYQNVVIGVIKSIAELPNGEKHMGIQILSRNPSWVQVTKVEGNTNNSTNPNNFLGFSGLHLPAEENLSDSPSFILPRSKFEINSTYQISTMNKIFVVRVGNTYEAKDDWIRVKLKS